MIWTCTPKVPTDPLVSGTPCRMLGIIKHSSTTKANNKLSFSSSEDCISRNMIIYSDPVFIITLDCTKGLESAAKLHDIVATTPAINKKICFNSSLQAVPTQDLFDLKDLKKFQFTSTILPYLISPNCNKFSHHVKTEEDQNVMCAFFEEMFNNLMTLNQSIISEALEKNALRWFKLIQRLLKHLTENLCLLDDKMAKASMKLVEIPSSSSNQTENKMISQNFIRIWQFMNIGSAYLLTLYLRSANISILLAANQCSAIIMNRTCLVNYKIKFNFKNRVIDSDDDLKRSNTYTNLLNWTHDHYNVLKERLPQNTLPYTRSKPNNLKECDYHSTTRLRNSLKHLDLTHSKEPDQYETDTESYHLGPSHSLHGSASFVSVRSIESSSWGPEKTASVTSIKSWREPRGCHLTQEFKDLINLCKTIYAQSKDWVTQLLEDTDYNNIRGLMYELCPSPSARKLIHDSTKNIHDFVQDKSLQYRKAFAAPEWYQNNRIIKNLCQNVVFTLFSSSSIAKAL